MSEHVTEASEAEIFSATALLGHDMASVPGRSERFSWECQQCGRMAYKENGQVWGTATNVLCDGETGND